MFIKALAIPADTDQPMRWVQIDTEDLDTMQQLVGGDIEFTPVDGEVELMLNEEGKLRGLPHNPRAQLILWAPWLANPEAVTPRLDPLDGDAVVLGAPDDEGNSTSLTPEQVQRYTGPMVMHGWDTITEEQTA